MLSSYFHAMPAGYHPCFSSVVDDDLNQQSTVVFDSDGSSYRFTFANPVNYAGWKLNENGTFFNASVRNSGVMTYQRLN